MVDFSLKGKTALVTGAAYGIGFAMAEALAEAGARIAFNCRSQRHKNNKPFKMYKFRSMRVAKAVTEASLRPDEDRIFPFGHFIRKVKIDELPQLLNILNGTMSIIGPRPVAQGQFEMFRYGKWNEAAKVSVGLSGPAALYDFIYGDQITDEKEYMEKVYPTRRELEYTYVQKAGIFYDLKMIVYTVVCILYAVCGKECTWMLNEFVEDAKMTMDK